MSKVGSISCPSVPKNPPYEVLNKFLLGEVEVGKPPQKVKIYCYRARGPVDAKSPVDFSGKFNPKSDSIVVETSEGKLLSEGNLSYQVNGKRIDGSAIFAEAKATYEKINTHEDGKEFKIERDLVLLRVPIKKSEDYSESYFKSYSASNLRRLENVKKLASNEQFGDLDDIERAQFENQPDPKGGSTADHIIASISVYSKKDLLDMHAQLEKSSQELLKARQELKRADAQLRVLERKIDPKGILRSKFHFSELHSFQEVRSRVEKEGDIVQFWIEGHPIQSRLDRLHELDKLKPLYDARERAVKAYDKFCKISEKVRILEVSLGSKFKITAC